MSSEQVATDPVAGPEGSSPEGSIAAPKRRRGPSPRWLALIAAIVVVDVVAFVAFPPFPRDGAPGGRPTRGRGGAPGSTASTSGDELIDDAGADPDEGRARVVPAAERRRAAELLVALWADLARDLALAAAGGGRSVRDPGLLDELITVAEVVAPGDVARFLDRAARAAELLVSNVSPELLLDSLVLAWPRGRAVA